MPLSLWPFRQIRRNRILSRGLVPDRLWRRCLADHPILAGFSQADEQLLRELTTVFLREKHFEPVQGLGLNELMRTSIAAQACLPVLHLGIDNYNDWSTIIVYPAEFVRPRQEFDTTGVMHEWEEWLGGESWERGPVVLSWRDVEASGWGDGYNVVVHEMAHKLDMRNGEADGYPLLHRGMRPSEWSQAFTGAYEDLARVAEREREPDIDEYATESPAEFFAVLSEYFFERPDLVAERYPQVFEQLRLYYRQDPTARLPMRPQRGR
jgi:hypothetical protein